MKMKKALLIAAAVFVPAILWAQAERELNLEESLATGLHNSQELLGFQEEIRIAREMVKEAGSQIYPKIDLNLSVSRLDNSFPAVLAPSFNSVYLPVQTEGSFYSTRFSLWQYLYANGRYSTNLSLAKTNLSQAKSRADIARNRIVLDIRRSYYACAALRDKIKAYEEAGASARSAAEFRMELLKLRHEYEKQKLRHLKTLGLELNTVIEIKGAVEGPAEEYDLNKCLAWAKNYRPELRQTQYQETIDSLRVNLSRAERYPTVTLGANYERLGDKLPLDIANWNATVNVNVPIFDGLASWSRVRQRKYQAREGKIKRAAIEDEISSQVREAYLDYGFWKGRLAELDPPAGGAAGKLQGQLLLIDTLEQALSSRAALEWSIGKIFFQ